VKQDRLRKTKATCFPSYVEDRSKDKHVHKNKNDHIQTQMYYISVIVEILYGTQGRRERIGQLSIVKV
jgi:hypothetical protein